jgi:hypothetical protein
VCFASSPEDEDFMALGRAAIAKRLLEIQKRIEPDLLAIDGFKEKLRELCTKAGEGFTEEVEGLGSVEVKAGTNAALKGVLPKLDPEAFLKLPSATRKGLIKSKLVIEEEQWSKATKPSVTVRL